MNVPESQTCHSLCENEEDCVAWTWTAEGKCRITGKGTALGTIKIKQGSFSGFKNSCKPKCYLLLGPEDPANTNTQICTDVNKDTGCKKMIHMEPDDFQEGDTILVCHEIQDEGRSECERDPVSFAYAHAVCNPQ